MAARGVAADLTLTLSLSLSLTLTLTLTLTPTLTLNLTPDPNPGAQLWIMNCGSRLQEAGHNVWRTGLKPRLGVKQTRAQA